MKLSSYQTEHFYDEMIDNCGHIRPWYSPVADKLQSLGFDEIQQRQYSAERACLSMGITFSVYGENQGIERIFPFDIIPRIINAREWAHIEKGLKQRIEALNLFLDDVYHNQNIIKDGIIPRELIFSSSGYLKQCKDSIPKGSVWTHISGIDIIKHDDGAYYVLEDNVRVPSGVAYVLGNREIMKRTFPDLFEKMHVCPTSDYPLKLRETLQSVSKVNNPTIVLLTPGIYNSAYFEHSYLAQQMGIALVEGRDLIVKDDFVYMQTTKGLVKVDVIYRRVDDIFIDPKYFRKDSMLGVRGLMDVYRNGNVIIANAPGTGIADDKLIYVYVPRIIKYYLQQDAILPNVPSYNCWIKKECDYVVENISKMVVKVVNQSGGYGIMIGPHADKTQHEMFKKHIFDNPRDYIAQPMMNLSRVPVITDNNYEGRHVDLRPYILYGKSIHILQGGLTRVALRKGSIVVNSSQGGGSKDTWVLRKPSRKTNTELEEQC